MVYYTHLDVHKQICSNFFLSPLCQFWFSFRVEMCAEVISQA